MEYDNMLFDIEIDGTFIPIQAVKRNGKVYFRFAPYTIDHPTPKQKEVRDRVAVGGYLSYDKDLETVNETVKGQFVDWVKTQKSSTSRALYNMLRVRYGNDAPSVVEYLTRKPAEHSYPAEEKPNIKKKVLIPAIDEVEV